MTRGFLLLFIFFLLFSYGCNAPGDGILYSVDPSDVSHIAIEYASQSAKADITDPQIVKDVLKVLKDVRGKGITSADIRETVFAVKLFQNDGTINTVTFGITADGLMACQAEKQAYQVEEKAYNLAVSGVLDAMRAWCTQLIPARDIPLTDNDILTFDKDTVVFSGEALDGIKRVKVLDCPTNKTLEIDEQTQNELIASLRTLSFANGMRLPFPFVLKPSPRYQIELYGNAQEQNAVFTINYYEEKSGFLYAVLLSNRSLAVLTSKTGLPAFR